MKFNFERGILTFHKICITKKQVFTFLLAILFGALIVLTIYQQRFIYHQAKLNSFVVVNNNYQQKEVNKLKHDINMLSNIVIEQQKEINKLQMKKKK